MKALKGKVAVVTGATSGIGRTTALALADEGVNLVLAGRRADKGEEVRKQAEAMGVKALFQSTDVAKEGDIKKLFETVEREFGHLDFAFNNAGVESKAAGVEAFNNDEYNRVMDTNVRGTMLSMKYEVPLMLKSGQGAIVNTSSIAGVVGIANFSIYVASKHAVIGLTKSAALELAPHGIRVNAVSPGAVLTEMFDRFAGHNDDAKSAFSKMHPLGRAGTADEIADSVLFLLSDNSSFITGQSLAVDGGYTTP
jgi:NAD(P)-dependent dehydrogenase (short-subunit alcohol dehydrogenase family)